MLDNERCILCTRCVRFTREISKSHALGVQERGDHSVIRPAGGRKQDARRRRLFRQHRRHLPRRRAAVQVVPVQVARLVPEGHTVGLPGLRARLRDRHLAPPSRVVRALARRGTELRDRARDAARQPRCQRPLGVQQGAGSGAGVRAPACRSADAQGPCRRARRGPVGSARARRAFAPRRRRSSRAAGSNEELQAFQRALGGRFTRFVKRDAMPLPGEVVADDLLIRADKNPNAFTARAAFRRRRGRVRAGDRSGPGLGPGRRVLAPAARRAGDLPGRLHAARERPRRRLPPAQPADRAGRALHQLRGRHERLRGLFREARPVVHAEDVFARLPRRRR